MITALALSPALDVTYLLDSVERGAIHRPDRVLRLAGGKALNLARAAAALGANATVIGPLGGRIGQLVADLAAADGVRLDVVDVAGETRCCVTAIPSDGAPTEFYENPEPLAIGHWHAVLDRLDNAPVAGWTVLAGRLPDSLPLGDLAAALSGRRKRGDRIAIDSSGPGVATLLALVTPDVVKVNRREAADIIETDATGSLLSLAQGIRLITAGTVVLTDGAAGAVAVDATGRWSALPDPQPGRFAVGSGDSFLAGLIVSLHNGATTGDALVLASAAGSANTRAPGAAVFSRADLTAISARIIVAASA